MEIYNKNKIDILGKAELRNAKLLFGLYAFLLITDYLMPQYFGVHLGYDITCTRLSNILIIFYMCLNPKIMTHFLATMVKCSIFPFTILYLFVCLYTMVWRTDINSLFLPFLEFLTLFMLVYGIRYVIGYKRAVKWSINCAYFLAVYGFIEFACGQSLYLKFLKTVYTAVSNTYRSGHYRVMGPCGHPLGYGLFLLILIAIACIDTENDEVYLFKRPVLIFLLLGNVLLTGSRSTLGVAGVEILLILIFSNRKNIKKSLVVGAIMIVALTVFLLLFNGTGIGRYIMMQLMSVVDQICGTSYAALYGADTSTLIGSEEYRKVLPLIFQLDWLNPFIGRGVSHSFSAYINGVYIMSIDNFYVSQYIKYAYPGLATYVLFILANLCTMLYATIKYKSGIAKLALIGTSCYFLNLWWLDTLQTQKYIYILIALFYAFYFARKDEEEYK